MKIINILLVNSIFLTAVLIILLSLLKITVSYKPKLKEDLQKIKNQISS